MDKRKLLKQKQELLGFVFAPTRAEVQQRLKTCSIEDLRILNQVLDKKPRTRLLDAICDYFCIKEKPLSEMTQQEQDQVVDELRISLYKNI
jgi:predicted flavoprotein YhiN